MSKKISLFKKYSLNRIIRIENKIHSLIDELDSLTTKKTKKRIATYLNEFNAIKKKVNVLKFINLIGIGLLYISIVSVIVQNTTLLGKVVGWIQLLSGLLGSTFLVILISFITRLINIYVSDAHLIADRIIAIHETTVYKNESKKRT